MALVTVGFLTVAGHSTVALAIAELAFIGVLMTLAPRTAILLRGFRPTILVGWFRATILRGWFWAGGITLDLGFATPLRVSLLEILVLRWLHIHREQLRDVRDMPCWCVRR